MTYDEAYGLAWKHRDLPVLIDGPHGPTGKTTLCCKLRAEGRIAYEMWEVEQDGCALTDGAYLLLLVDELLPAYREKWGERSLMAKYASPSPAGSDI